MRVQSSAAEAAEPSRIAMIYVHRHSQACAANSTSPLILPVWCFDIFDNRFLNAQCETEKTETERVRAFAHLTRPPHR